MTCQLTSNFKPAPRVSRGKGASALTISGMEVQHSSLLRVRTVPRSMWLGFTLSNGAATARCFSPFDAKTVVRCASCGLKLEASAAWLARHRRGGARCLWGGDAARELASRARGAALAVIGSCLVERCRAGETALSFGARPWCDMTAATSNFKPEPRVSRSTGASALAVSGMEAQHSSLLRVRAVLRSMWPDFTLSKGAATARCFSSSAQKPWCDVPAAASNSKPAPRGSRGEDAAALAVSGKEAQHSSLIRARAVPRWL